MFSSQSSHQLAIIVTDLTYGDAGKGSIIDFFARHFAADVVVRFNGGAQAAHNVITDDGRHHTFAQFGSGMFLPNTQSLLSRFMILDPLAMLNEAEHLQEIGVENPFGRTTIDQRALIITPFHQAANRLKEMARGQNRHGSCGMGIGETVSDHLRFGQKMLFAGDLCDPETMAQKLRFIQATKSAEIDAIHDQVPQSEQSLEAFAILDDPNLIDACAEVYGYFADVVEIADQETISRKFSSAKTLLFEGAQGVLLDEDYGFHPYTTWSKTTFQNAKTILDEMNFRGQIIELGLTRAYATRHGAGPFVSEDTSLHIPDSHNIKNDWQQDFRVGYLDLVALKYAVEVAGGVDCLGITTIDRLDEFPTLQICTAYHYNGDPADLSAYFEHDGQRISAINVKNPPTLDHQTELTKLLFNCTPCYQAFSKNDYINFCVHFIEENLGIPIGITSHGPTANDKLLTPFWYEQFTG